jgi:hypothetical protein
MVILLCPATRL